MNSEEARILLSACRDNANDRADPVFQEALALTETDPDLKAWWVREQAFDQAFRKKLAETLVPATLKAEILAGMHATRAAAPKAETGAGHSRKILSFPGSPLLWAAAAAAVLVLGVALLQTPAAPEPAAPTGQADNYLPASFISFLEQAPPPGYQLDRREGNLANLKAYLAEAGSPTPVAIPKNLTTGGAIGCMTLNYKGYAIGMICFDAGGKLAHLFALDKASLNGDLPTDLPALFQGEQNSYAVWTVDNQVLVLKRPGTPDELKNYL
ncbi:MAG: hypothetical protein ACFE0O_01225 [Opitutales bacterium]